MLNKKIITALLMLSTSFCGVGAEVIKFTTGNSKEVPKSTSQSCVDIIAGMSIYISLNILSDYIKREQPNSLITNSVCNALKMLSCGGVAIAFF